MKKFIGSSRARLSRVKLHLTEQLLKPYRLDKTFEPSPCLCLHRGVEFMRCFVKPRAATVGHAGFGVAGVKFGKACLYTVQIEQAILGSIDYEERRWHGQ